MVLIIANLGVVRLYNVALSTVFVIIKLDVHTVAIKYPFPTFNYAPLQLATIVPFRIAKSKRCFETSVIKRNNLYYVVGRLFISVNVVMFILLFAVS
jgi:hypothetical protein